MQRRPVLHPSRIAAFEFRPETASRAGERLAALEAAGSDAEAEAALLADAGQHRFDLAAELPLPAYEMVVKASHTFNLLDARRAISVTARQQYILRVRSLARSIAQSYLLARAKLGFPMATPELRDEVLAKLEAAE